MGKIIIYEAKFSFQGGSKILTETLMAESKDIATARLKRDYGDGVRILSLTEVGAQG